MESTDNDLKFNRGTEMIVTNLDTLKDTFPKIWQYAEIALDAHGKDPEKQRRQPIKDSQVFFTLSEDPLEPQEDRRLEVHKKYLDIQIVLEGTERYGYIPGAYAGTFEEERFESDDVAFTSRNEPCQYADLTAGDAIIFLPGHAHKPLCIPADQNKKVRKAIIKVEKALVKELFF